MGASDRLLMLLQRRPTPLDFHDLPDELAATFDETTLKVLVSLEGAAQSLETGRVIDQCVETTRHRHQSRPGALHIGPAAREDPRVRLLELSHDPAQGLAGIRLLRAKVPDNSLQSL